MVTAPDTRPRIPALVHLLGFPLTSATVTDCGYPSIRGSLCTNIGAGFVYVLACTSRRVAIKWGASVKESPAPTPIRPPASVPTDAHRPTRLIDYRNVRPRLPIPQLLRLARHAAEQLEVLADVWYSWSTVPVPSRSPSISSISLYKVVSWRE